MWNRVAFHYVYKGAMPMKALILSLMIVGCILPDSLAGEEKKRRRPSAPALKALRQAVLYLQANQTEKGIEKLKSVVQEYPGDPAAEKAEELLRDNGVGEGVRVFLVEREAFHKRLKIDEKTILEQQEKILDQMRSRFAGLKKPYFKKSFLELHFYDSQARYRQHGGLVTSTGHFRVTKTDLKDINARSMDAKIEWYFTRQAGTLKDRQTAIDSLLYHETAHYLITVHFGRTLPSFLDEGLATFFESRLNTEFYQSFRATRRQRIESNARNSLNAIAKYENFEAMLDAPRGFGRGDVMINRWYGICYSIVDFIDQSTLNSRKASVNTLLKALEERVEAQLEKMGEKDASRKDLEPFPAKKLLEEFLAEFYGVQLRDFHRALLNHIMTKYKQM